MKSRPIIFLFLLIFAPILSLTAICPPCHGVTLLSDRIMSGISGGQTVTVFIEDGTAAAVSADHFYYGDRDGTPDAPRPGYLDFTIPPSDFQSRGLEADPRLYPNGFYTDFEYRFSTQAEADRFQETLETENNFENIRQRVIYSPASAETPFLDDGAGPAIEEVIVVTEEKASPNLAKRFNGEVVQEPVVWRINFPTIAESVESYERVTDTDGFFEDQWLTRDYGKLMEAGMGRTGAAPLRHPETNNVLVPAETVFLKTTLAPMEIYSPAVGVAISLAPEGDPNTGPFADLLVGKAYQPDYAAARQLGNLTISGINIRISGTSETGEFGQTNDGRGLYIYANED